jgi:hypothetical protein
MTSHTTIVGSLSVILTLVVVPTAGAGKSAGATIDDCFAELEQGTGEDIRCAWPVSLSDGERKDLKKASREYLEDVSCKVEIKIKRADVNQALTAADLVFESPPQPMSCDVTTYKGVTKISATFAPRVVFKGGQAVEGTPGLGNVTGVSKVLSWPVVQFVNRWPSVKRDMVKIINVMRRPA